MDLLELLLKEPTIQEYLRSCPEEELFQLVKKTFLVGVSAIKACQDSGLARPRAERHRSRPSTHQPKSQKFISVVKSSRKIPQSALKRNRRSSTRTKKPISANENEDPRDILASQESPQPQHSSEFTFKPSLLMKQAFHKEFKNLLPFNS